MMKVYNYPGRYRLEVEGHAGFSASGTDIVCAAASMLFYTLAHSLKDRKVNGLRSLISADATIHRIQCAPTEEQRGAVNVVFETIMCGFTALASMYPEYVRICEVPNEGDQR